MRKKYASHNMAVSIIPPIAAVIAPLKVPARKIIMHVVNTMSTSQWYFNSVSRIGQDITTTKKTNAAASPGRVN
jgi:hypothetical protein